MGKQGDDEHGDQQDVEDLSGDLPPPDVALIEPEERALSRCGLVGVQEDECGAFGVPTQLVLVLVIDHADGLTVDETCAAAGYPRYSLQPRFTALKDRKAIFDTGLRRRNVSGAKAIVWRIHAPRALNNSQPARTGENHEEAKA